jgi:hypothetical protein
MRPIRPPTLDALSDAFQIQAMTGDIPSRWRKGRDSIAFLGIYLMAVRDHALYRKLGFQTWDEYCIKFLKDPAEAFDSLIDSACVLRCVRRKPD